MQLAIALWLAPAVTAVVALIGLLIYALLGGLRRRAEAHGSDLTARDALSPIQAAHWAVDSTDDWQPTHPTDLIYDSTTEKVAITIPDLEPGTHVVTLRLTDARGNAYYKAQVVEVK